MLILFLVGVFTVGVVVLYFRAENMLGGAVSIATRMGSANSPSGSPSWPLAPLRLNYRSISPPRCTMKQNLAFGDLVGSNIANIGLILGIAAIVSPLRVKMRLLRAELPIAISVSLLVLALAWDGVVSRQDGVIMLDGFVLFAGYAYRAGRQESASVQSEFKDAVERQSSIPQSWLKVVFGLAGLVLGAQLMVYSATEFAKLVGVSELVSGLTIVALGTSLPELATSVVAARCNDADIVVGNVTGANIFNICLFSPSWP